MDKRFNFQINSDRYRYWQDVPVISKILPHRRSAVKIAKNAAKLFKADVRLTEGNNPMNNNGAYFSYQEQD